MINHEVKAKEFMEYYDSNIMILNNVQNIFKTIITALLSGQADIPFSKIEGRVKEKEECIKKFNLKYKDKFDKSGEDYEIKNHISDLIALRIVCLYEDQVESIAELIKKAFTIVDKTDKTREIEEQENSFGYKGLHLDVRLNEDRNDLAEYKQCSPYQFEIQIRTIIQDSWSVLDHKIKYKKSIPANLKRRINRLAALFEIADNEFREIRVTTDRAIQDAEKANIDEPKGDSLLAQGAPINLLNAFDLLKIVHHFFPEYDFEGHKIDSFTQEIIQFDLSITRGEFNAYLKDNITKVKKFAEYLKQEESLTLNPYTIVRHCLYLSDNQKFVNILRSLQRERFDSWLEIDRSDSIAK